jgi:hypothetical protein
VMVTLACEYSLSVAQDLRAPFQPFHVASTLPDSSGARIESQTTLRREVLRYLAVVIQSPFVAHLHLLRTGRWRAA